MIARPAYLKRLIQLRHNHMIKIVTGIRRCGKSYLLFEIFAQWLQEQGISNEHIIKIDLENRRNHSLRDPDNLLAYIDTHVKDKDMHYVMIDEIQHVPEFEDVLNSYLKSPNVDLYVTGSNARFLSKDVVTTFRGRGITIEMYPLSFSEFHSAVTGTKEEILRQYYIYGGMPQVPELLTDEDKAEYLKDLFTETYIRDIVERYNFKDTETLSRLLDILSSSIGSLTNPTRLVNIFASTEKIKLSNNTITSYLDALCDSFLVSKAQRYDVKGNRYIDTPYKFYFTDMGLRNARLNFRQIDISHIMENVIYNELRSRRYNVDVGVVRKEIRNAEGKRMEARYEIDFVCNQGSRRYYIQSALEMPDEAKIRQEETSLRNVGDSFKKIIVLGHATPVLHTAAGITVISIYDFLLNPNSLEL